MVWVIFILSGLASAFQFQFYSNTKASTRLSLIGKYCLYNNYAELIWIVVFLSMGDLFSGLSKVQGRRRQIMAESLWTAACLTLTAVGRCDDKAQDQPRIVPLNE
jgi:hypothetical protein